TASAATSSPSAPASATSSATISPATPASTPIAGFAAASVTFVSSDDGWALGTVGGALALARTQDGGSSWTSLTPPPTHFSGQGVEASSGVSGIRFANTENGWAYGPELWATQDGGSTWTEISLPGVAAGSPVWSLETSGGSVAAAVQATGTASLDIETSAVGSSAWSLSPASVEVGAGPIPSPQLVLQGSAGWLLENDRTVVGGARLQSGSWSSWTPACSTEGGAAALAASSSQDLLAVCDVGAYTSSSPAEDAFVSTNGGSSFTGLSASLPSGCQGSATLASASSSLAAAGCGAEVVATFNGGGSWVPVYSGPSGTSIAYVGFTTTTQGVAIATAAGSAAGTLLMTRNGGANWAAVTI
ncbi:MAG: YCF48-related protein, partial [Candidatus Dormiibacterota bacterium]